MKSAGRAMGGGMCEKVLAVQWEVVCVKSVGSAMGGGMCEKCWQCNGRWYV